MGHDVLKGKTRKCKCFLVGDNNLQCYAKGVIGTLSNKQEKELCEQDTDELENKADKATDEMVNVHNKFRNGLKEAEKEYEEYRETHGPNVEKWLDILSKKIGE